MLLGVKTLALLAAEPRWLDLDVVVRVPRAQTMRLLKASTWRVPVNGWLDGYMRRLFDEAREALAKHGPVRPVS